MTDNSFIKNNLESLLGIKLTAQEIKESSNGEKKGFCKLIDKLENLIEVERAMYRDYKVDTSTLLEPYWDAIEEMLDFTCEPEIADVIWWYVHSRKDAEGTIAEWEDEDGDGKKYILKNSSELFDYINFKN
jgi:hypothetical protein|tara:strand:- start:358 stop:750 length:393 start_codon:yes stop_codon:yes gene_type:complete